MRDVQTLYMTSWERMLIHKHRNTTLMNGNKLGVWTGIYCYICMLSAVDFFRWPSVTFVQPRLSFSAENTRVLAITRVGAIP